MANSDCGKILAVIGGVIILISGIFGILGALGMAIGYTFPTSGYFGIALGALSLLIWSILELLIGIVILGECGIGRKRTKSRNGVVLLILGIVAIILFNLIGGLLVIIGAIILLL